VPVAQFFYSFQLVLGITALLHVFSNISKIILFGKHINYTLLLNYGLPGIITVTVGAYLTTQVKLEYAQLSLGVSLVLFSLALLYYDQFNPDSALENAETTK
jgi:uncharacterized membrane protein YfcA